MLGPCDGGRSQRGCIAGRCHRIYDSQHLGARDRGDETGDVALDLVRWQVVAGAGVRLAEIAADDEGAQPRVGQAFRLRDGKPADHLHRGGDAPVSGR